jgi:hypothetical protein
VRKSTPIEVRDAESSVRVYYSVVISFFLSFVILCFRKPTAFTNPRLCFEDGPVFFGQAITFGWKSLTIPYAGYYHTVPRLVAILFNLIIPPEHMGISYNIAAGIISAIVAVAILLSDINIEAKWFFAIVPFLMPQGGGVSLTLTNVQWIIAPYFMLLCMQHRDNKSAIRIIKPILIFTIATTGPFSIFLLPIFTVRMILYWKSKNEKILFSAVAAGALVQIYSVMTHHFASVGAFVDWPLVPEWAFWGVIAPLFGYPNVSRLTVQILFFVLIVPLAVSFVRLEVEWRIRIYAMALFSIGILSAGLMRVGGHQIQLVNPFISGGERYFFVPYAMTGWALFILATKAPGYWKAAGAFALFLAIAANIGRFTAPVLSDLECYNPSIVGLGSVPEDQIADAVGSPSLKFMHLVSEPDHL